MHPSAPAPTGILDSLRAFGGGLIASLQDRVQLLSVELQEEKFRLIQIFIWISAAVFAGVMAITFASLTLVFFFWDSARLVVLGGLTLFYAGLATIIVIAFRRYLKRQPQPFASTIEELQEDAECIRKEH